MGQGLGLGRGGSGMALGLGLGPELGGQSLSGRDGAGKGERVMDLALGP